MNTAGTNEINTNDVTALSVRVGALEGDIREFGDRLLGLDTKIDKAVAGLATEFRSSFAAISAQLSERQRTPWVVLIAAGGFIVTVLTIFGNQALTPMQADIKALKEEIVPRKEIDYRSESSNRRLIAIEGDVRRLEDSYVADMKLRLRDLEIENRDLKRNQR